MIYNIGSGGGGNSVFVATPNVTTYAELISAIAANKIIVIGNDIIVTATQTTNNISLIGPTYTDGDDVVCYKYIVDNQNTWTTNLVSEEYQWKLVSGTNIKTINNNSILGSGNLTIDGGCTVQIERW